MGWETTENLKENIVIKLTNKNLYEKTICLDLSTNYKIPDYSDQITATIRKLVQLDERIKGKFQTEDFLQFVQNHNLQFSPRKKEWIIPELTSKYLENDIPSVYLPKKDYI